jgi:hypothetical protein
VGRVQQSSCQRHWQDVASAVDKRVVIRSDRYLNVRVIININTIREDWRNVKNESNQYMHLRQLDYTVNGRPTPTRRPRRARLCRMSPGLPPEYTNDFNAHALM